MQTWMTKKTKLPFFIINFLVSIYVHAHTHTYIGYDKYAYLNPASVTLQLWTFPHIIKKFVKIWLVMMHNIPLCGWIVVYLMYLSWDMYSF